MKLKDVDVQVQMEGSSLEEYDVRYDEEAGNRIKCYIISEAGKKFAFRVSNGSQNAISTSVFIDGVPSDQMYICRAREKLAVSGIYLDSETLRPFMFSHLKLTDNDSAVTTSLGEIILQDMGTLRLDFHRVTVLRTSELPHHYKATPVVDDNVVLHEKTKKAGAHRVQLGEKECAKDHPQAYVDYIDSETGAPYMSFTFLYRPKEMLQAQGIVPPEKAQPVNVNGKRPGPEDAGPSKRTRTNDNLPATGGSSVKAESDNEEVRALMAQRAALDARIREAEERAVKREPSPIVLGAAKGAVIDLTLD